MSLFWKDGRKASGEEEYAVKSPVSGVEEEKINLKIVCFWQETSLSCLKRQLAGGTGDALFYRSLSCREKRGRG